MTAQPQAFATESRVASSSPFDRMAKNHADSGEVILEFMQHGQLLRVSAFDVDRLIEAVIIGPRNAPRHALEAAVLQKLRYLQGKNEP